MYSAVGCWSFASYFPYGMCRISLVKMDMINIVPEGLFCGLCVFIHCIVVWSKNCNMSICHNLIIPAGTWLHMKLGWYSLNIFINSKFFEIFHPWTLAGVMSLEGEYVKKWPIMLANNLLIRKSSCHLYSSCWYRSSKILHNQGSCDQD